MYVLVLCKSHNSVSIHYRMIMFYMHTVAACCRLMYVYMYINIVVPNNSDDSSDSGAIIGGAVGGVILLLMIIVVLCIVILCMRRSHRKKGSHVVDNATKLNTNVTIDHNPSYDVTKVNTVYMEHLYDTIDPGDSDVPITANPSNNVHTKCYNKTSEDEYNYVQPNEFTQHSESDGYMKIYPTTGQSHGIRGVHSHPTANTPKQDEYGVVNQPRS